MGLCQVGVGLPLDLNRSQWLLRIFPIFSEQVVCDLSTDQFYAYNICWAHVYGEIDNDLIMI